jgi:hypothetical protein
MFVYQIIWNPQSGGKLSTGSLREFVNDKLAIQCRNQFSLHSGNLCRDLVFGAFCLRDEQIDRSRCRSASRKLHR